MSDSRSVYTFSVVERNCMEISFQNMFIVDSRSFPFTCVSDWWLRPTCSCPAMDILSTSGRKAILVCIEFVRYCMYIAFGGREGGREGGRGGGEREGRRGRERG